MQRPEDVVPAWERAWNAGDADAIGQLFVEDADFVNVVGLWWHDRGSIRDAHAFGFARMFPGSHMEMREPRVRHLGSGAAVVQCQWHMTGQVDPHGTRVDDRQGIFTFVMQRREAGWFAVAAHNTDIRPGAQTNINRGPGSRSVHYGRRARPAPDAPPSQ